MKSIRNTLIVATLAVSCLTTPISYAGEENIINWNNEISALRDALAKAESNELNLFAPTLVNNAKKKHNQAIKKMETSNKVEASAQLARQGLGLIKAAEIFAAKHNTTLQPVFDMRTRALVADAGTLFPEQTQSSDNKLSHLADLLKQGNDKDAKALAKKLTENYRQLEMTSLKTGLTTQARTAYNDAMKVQANRYAPKTIKLAKDEFDTANDLLQTDRHELGAAKSHAEHAKHLAQQAHQITLTAKEFEKNNFATEDFILWHQQQLMKVAASLHSELMVNLGEEFMINQLTGKIGKLEDAIDSNNKTLNAKQNEIKRLQTRLLSQLSHDARNEYLQKQAADRYATVEQLFTKQEARVYRVSNDVLIKAHGFSFPIGKANVEAENYPMAHKIIESIGEFPQFKKIIISGHTDSTGNATLNHKLSQARADNVKALLISLGHIPADQIETRGFGDKRPVESNKTSQGKKYNRRVEIQIVN